MRLLYGQGQFSLQLQTLLGPTTYAETFFRRWPYFQMRYTPLKLSTVSHAFSRRRTPLARISLDVRQLQVCLPLYSLTRFMPQAVDAM